MFLTKLFRRSGGRVLEDLDFSHELILQIRLCLHLRYIYLIFKWNIETRGVKVEGMLVEPLIGVFDFAPLAIVRPFASPVFALTKRLKMAAIKLLQRTCNIHFVPRHSRRCIRFASKLSVLPRPCDAIGDQPLHFFQLS
jgi:hypothetical protein